MPVPRHIKIVFGGSLKGEDKTDEWSCGLTMNSVLAGQTDFEIDQGRLDAIAADVLTFWNTVKTSMTGTVALEYVKANNIGTDGKYASKSTTWLKTYATPQPGVAGGNTLPWSSAIAVSLRTQRQRGIGSKGRFYLPAPTSGALTAAGQLHVNTANAILGATAQLIANLNNWPGLDTSGPEVCVVSDGGKFGQPLTERVTRVQVGNRLDTQQRRANNDDESYVSQAVPGL